MTRDRDPTLPKGLYARRKGNTVYYAYREPHSGCEVGFGTNKAQAIYAVHQYIARRDAETPGKAGRGVEKLLARALAAGLTLHAMLDQWLAYWKEEDLPEKGTYDNERWRVGRIKREIADENVIGIDRLKLADFLDKVSRGEQQKYRSTLHRAFAWAVAKGHLNDNPAEKTLRRKPPGRARRRLTDEQYKTIYAHASEELQIGMELVRRSLQRPGDLCSLTTKSWDGSMLRVKQSKTGKQLEITPDDTLTVVIRRAVARRVDTCQALVCYEPDTRARSDGRVGGKRMHWAHCTGDMLNDQFRELFRQHFPGITSPPTLYECKALGVDECKRRGWTTAEVQNLAGHEKAATTKIYEEGHDSWHSVDLRKRDAAPATQLQHPSAEVHGA